MSTKANYKQTVSIHQLHVSTLMKRIASDLRSRGNRHDISKFSGIEATLGDMYHADYTKINVLAPSKLDVDDYETKVKAAIIEHHKLNDHHVEHFEGGIDDMSLVQLAELICDSLAHLQERGHNTNECLYEIEQQFKGYGASDNTISIIKNTVKYLCGE